MQIKPDEITSILKSRIEGLEAGEADLAEVGTVLSVGDGIARLHGLENCEAFEMLELPHDVTGLALNLESDNVGVVLFGDWEKIVEGDTAKRTGKLLEIPVGEELLGRIVDPLGRPLDGKGEVNTSETRPAEFKAPGVVQRQPVKEPMQTGLKAIDSMIPIGRGQRELIIGDRQTGKSAIAIDTIINNKDSDLVCIYAAIGQRMSTVVQVAQTLEDHGAMDRTIIVAAAADEAAPIKYMAPYAACAMGQIFLEGDLFRKGVRPAINVGISVSRVGGNAQPTPMRKVAGRLRLDLSQFRELEAFAQFGSDLDPETQKSLARGERLVETLNQDELKPWSVADQVAAIYSGTAGWLDRIKTERVKEFHDFMLQRIHAEQSELMQKIADGDWDDQIEETLAQAIREALDDFGCDFDEEGQELEEGESDRIKDEQRRHG